MKSGGVGSGFGFASEGVEGFSAILNDDGVEDMI
jgi:hypothetical protein